MKKTFTKKTHKNVTYEALIDLRINKEGQHKIDILPCEDVIIEEFLGGFSAKGQQDGSIFLKEKPKRKRLRNTPDFRTPRLYMSLDCQDGYDYIGFRLPSDQRENLARLLLKDTNLAVKYLNERMYN